MGLVVMRCINSSSSSGSSGDVVLTVAVVVGLVVMSY